MLIQLMQQRGCRAVVLAEPLTGRPERPAARTLQRVVEKVAWVYRLNHVSAGRVLDADDWRAPGEEAEGADRLPVMLAYPSGDGCRKIANELVRYVEGIREQD